jgi:hypothetical protein
MFQIKSPLESCIVPNETANNCAAFFICDILCVHICRLSATVTGKVFQSGGATRVSMIKT